MDKTYTVMILTPVILLSGLYMSIMALDHPTDSTPEYQQAYKLAYAEHNETKYSAALEIIQGWGIGYTEEQCNYAHGYQDGYIAYDQDVQYQEYLNERNNTVKTLFGR